MSVARIAAGVPSICGQAHRPPLCGADDESTPAPAADGKGKRDSRPVDRCKGLGSGLAAARDYIVFGSTRQHRELRTIAVRTPARTDRGDQKRATDTSAVPDAAGVRATGWGAHAERVS